MGKSILKFVGKWEKLQENPWENEKREPEKTINANDGDVKIKSDMILE